MASTLIRVFRRAGRERGHRRAGRGRRQKWHTRTRRARWFKGRGLLRATMMLQAAFLRSFSCLRGVRSLGLPIGSTAAVIALATFSAPVKALGFHWRLNSFNGQPVSGGVVKGAISGLLDNTSSQTAGLIVAVDSAPNTPAGGWINDGPFSGETGFLFSTVRPPLAMLSLEASPATAYILEVGLSMSQGCQILLWSYTMPPRMA